MLHNKIFAEIKVAHKGQSSAMVRYVIRDDSELGFSLQSEFFEFRNVDKCMLSIHIITHRPDFASFSGTESGVKWVYKNVIVKMMEMNSQRKSNVN